MVQKYGRSQEDTRRPHTSQIFLVTKDKEIVLLASHESRLRERQLPSIYIASASTVQ